MFEIDLLGRGGSLHHWNGRRDGVHVWALNHTFLLTNGIKVDRIFAMHDFSEYDPGKLPELVGDWDLGVKALNDSEAEIVCFQNWKSLKKGFRYPFEFIEDETGCNYFVNSMAYALALACVEGVKKINLYGCDFDKHNHDLSEVSGVEFWLGYCRGQGIEITNTPTSLLMPEYRYCKEKDCE